MPQGVSPIINIIRKTRRIAACTQALVIKNKSIFGKVHMQMAEEQESLFNSILNVKKTPLIRGKVEL